MSILKPVEAAPAFLKMALYGEQGSGKTYTAALVAIGLVQRYYPGSTVAFVDTEGKVQKIKPLFDAAGVPLVAIKTRAVQATGEAIREAVQSQDIHVLIVDSVSHLWDEIQAAYAKKINRRNGALTLRDWGPVKSQWRERFTTPYVNSPLHCICCGRAAAEFADTVDEQTGDKGIERVGTRMRAEKELGYEADLLVQMDLVPIPGSALRTHRATVVKDCALAPDKSGAMVGALEGQTFDDPTFESFMPVIETLSIGGVHEPIGNDDSTGLFQKPDSYAARQEDSAIAMEELEAVFVREGVSTRSADGKKLLLDLLEEHFDTTSWKAVGTMRAGEIRRGTVGVKGYFSCQAGDHEWSVPLPGHEDMVGCDRPGCVATRDRVQPAEGGEAEPASDTEEDGLALLAGTAKPDPEAEAKDEPAADDAPAEEESKPEKAKAKAKGKAPRKTTRKKAAAKPEPPAEPPQEQEPDAPAEEEQPPAEAEEAPAEEPAAPAPAAENDGQLFGDPQAFLAAANTAWPVGEHEGVTLDQIGATDDGLRYLLYWSRGSRMDAHPEVKDALAVYLAAPAIAADVARVTGTA